MLSIFVSYDLPPPGQAWSADRRWMFWIDSATNCVERFRYDASTGAISDRAVVVRT